MSIAMTLYHDSVSTPTGYAVYAEARLGANGFGDGTPELVVGHDAEDADYGRITWDGDESDGFDSGNAPGVFTASFAGGTAATLNAGSEVPTYTSAASGVIAKVQIRVLTQALAKVEWSTVCIKFYRDGVLVDSYAPETGPSVDTRSSPQDPVAESILEVTPSGTDYDKVVVTGGLYMAYDSTSVWPGGSDLAAQIFVYTSNA
ncbi:MAG: hypothetical protein JWO31_350 [Phycisphaerales bacterium]|nr:hypothetical protein [Phycisphaerales bacterium]